jgi:hypothetical protein
MRLFQNPVGFETTSPNEKIAADSAGKSAGLQPRKGLEGCEAATAQPGPEPRKARFFAVKPQKMRPIFLKKVSSC